MTTSRASVARCLLRPATVAVVVATITTAQSSDECASLKRACAAFDLHLVALIEKAGDADTIDGRDLFEANLALMRARRDCVAGSAGALRLYDAIDVVSRRVDHD